MKINAYKEKTGDGKVRVEFCFSTTEEIYVGMEAFLRSIGCEINTVGVDDFKTNVAPTQDDLAEIGIDKEVQAAVSSKEAYVAPAASTETPATPTTTPTETVVSAKATTPAPVSEIPAAVVEQPAQPVVQPATPAVQSVAPSAPAMPIDIEYDDSDEELPFNDEEAIIASAEANAPTSVTPTPVPAATPAVQAPATPAPAPAPAAPTPQAPAVESVPVIPTGEIKQLTYRFVKRGSRVAGPADLINAKKVFEKVIADVGITDFTTNPKGLYVITVNDAQAGKLTELGYDYI